MKCEPRSAYHWDGVSIEGLQIDLTDLLRLKKVTSVIQEHLLDTGVKNNRIHWSLVTRIGPTPTSMRISKVNLYPVNSFGLIFTLCLEDKLFKNGVVPCDDAATE